MEKKKSNLIITQDDIVAGMRRDYSETTEKQITVPVKELSRYFLRPGGNYLQRLWSRVDYGRTRTKKDFFVEVLIKLEDFIRKFLERKYHYRVLCPAPRFGQAVYHWNARKQKLDLLWDLPVKKACISAMKNRFDLRFPATVRKAVLDMQDGTLMAITRKFNKEPVNGTTYIPVSEEEFEKLKELG